MDSSSDEDPNKLSSTLQDPTPTQPLLSKPYPPLDPPPPITLHSAASEPIEDQSQFLQISYKYGPRHFKDWPFLLLFFLLVLATFGFGIFASVHKNPHHSQVSSFFYNSTSSTCSLLEVEDHSFLSDPISLHALKSSVLKSLTWTLAITLILSLPFVFFCTFVTQTLHQTVSVHFTSLLCDTSRFY